MPQTGLLVPPKDPAALAGAIQTLSESAALRAQFGRAARARAESRFSLREHAEHLQEIYDTLVGRAR